ncbi:Mitochondrial intermediate peptidase [Phytophthora cinnamomi]|uniref:Mitochondrial intermediate peptidase n=1 Tax=Phytophthora cinnamomi TaxID=4785 RepID=UPI003559C98C|nr:Mitochondrial intermediate peptidase [Phytophthora cinnamomi]
MAMRFHQKRFFAYPNGAPSLHTLSSVASHSYTLVTTDRSVSLLGYGDAGYSLHKLEVDALHAGKADVVASAAIERSDARQARVAIAYAVGDTLFLQVVAPHHESLGNGEAAQVAGCGKFELEAAPTHMFTVKASGSTGDVFYGVMVCCTDTMIAFGYVESESESSSTSSAADCARLDNEQFAAFFPEFATFSHTVLATDVFTSPERGQGWIAFGCADGLVRVFRGQVQGGCLGGPFKTKDLQLNGPVTSVALFPKRSSSLASSWQCNLLVTCAIGQAVVYEDVYSGANGSDDGEVLVDSDTFDSIFAGIIADIDLDGEAELLLGTDSQVLLAYKAVRGTDTDAKPMDDSKHSAVFEDAAKDLVESSVESPDSSHNIWSVHSAPGSALAERRKWQRLTRSRWDLETFGAIYSLLWRDVNHDGVPELLVASSTGVYVYEADPAFVIKKLESVLSALATSTTRSSSAQ